MYSKAKIENEQFYWNKQIERHHIAKRIRNLARKINYKPYKQLARKLNISRKTVWALSNGLAIAGKNLIERLNKLENEINYTGKAD